MQIEIEGEGIYEVPDDATPEEIAELTAGPAEQAAPPAPIGKVESAIRGGLQGASLGWSDELAASLDALMPGLSRRVNPDILAAAPQGADYGMRRAAALEAMRRRNAEAQEANPKTYLALQVAGATAPTLIGGAPLTGAKAMGIAAGQGAAQGAGYSDATSGRGLGSDTLLGAALGLGGYGAGQVVGKGASALRGAGARRLSRATARAEEQAREEVAEDLASKVGQVGAETQKGSRYVENLMRLEEAMTPAQRELYAQLQSAGIVPGLQRTVAQGTLDALPGQAATIAAKRAALEAAQTAAPAATAARSAELLTPQVGTDVRSFLKAYAEPLAWGFGAERIADAAGAEPQTRAAAGVIAGAIGGRTRAGKALLSRINRPGNQAAIARLLQRNADRADSPIGLALRRALATGAPASILASQQEPTP